MAELSKRKFILSVNQGWMDSPYRTTEAKREVYDRACKLWLKNKPDATRSSLGFISTMVGALPIDNPSATGLKNARWARIFTWAVTGFLSVNALFVPELAVPVVDRIGLGSVLLLICSGLFFLARQTARRPFGSNFDALVFIAFLFMTQVPRLALMGFEVHPVQPVALIFPAMIFTALAGMMITARRARVRLASNCNIIGRPYQDSEGHIDFRTIDEVRQDAVDRSQMMRPIP
jgi:hypothetical protein